MRTNTLVRRVVFHEDNVARGVELADGQILEASREVIICCGPIRTPQVLMLSGVGPADELQRHGIRQRIEAAVGKNFHDHCCLAQFYKVCASMVTKKVHLLIGCALTAQGP